MAKLLLIQGPNLNLLGQREPTWYGTCTLEDLHRLLEAKATKLGHQLMTFQSNSESDIVNKIQATQKEGFDFMIINAAAFTHTSISIRDAIMAMQLPFVDVHISNIYQREPFRRQSLLSDIAIGSIVGLGVLGYEFALDFLDQYVKKTLNSLKST